MSFRVPPALKKAMDRAAEQSGRSIAQEIELRLDQSFRNDAYLDQAMDLAYGPRLAVLLAIIGRAMTEVGRHAPNAQPFPADWMDQPHIFHEAAAAVEEALEAFQPYRERPSTNAILAPMIVRKLLGAVREPDEAGQLKHWGGPLHAKMGDAAARLRIRPWAEVTGENSGTFKVRYREGSNQ